MMFKQDVISYIDLITQGHFSSGIVDCGLGSPEENNGKQGLTLEILKNYGY